MGQLGWLYKAVDGDPAHIVDFLRWLAGHRGLADPVRVLDVGAGGRRMLVTARRSGFQGDGAPSAVQGQYPHFAQPEDLRPT